MPQIDWRSLPPLSALRAFEATARAGTFSGAARALNVTPAAIAQQVRGLEGELGLPLAVRAGRGVTLTTEGARLAAILSEGFGTIAEGITGLREEDARRGVRVSLTQGFAQWVLMPRLGAFWTRHPDIPVSLDATSNIAKLGSGGADLAIRSALAEHTPKGAERLVQSRYVLVGAPGILGDGPPSPEALARQTWILNRRDPQEDRWLADLGLDRAALRVMEVESPVLEVGSAIRGYGLMFGIEVVLREELASGRLAEIPAPFLPEAAYYMVTPEGPLRPQVQTFVTWLKAAFAEG